MKREPVFSVLISACRVDTFCSGGPGGQHQNRTRSGVRITHPPSGAIGESREYRSQHQNKAAAWKRMGAHPKFVTWCKMRVAEITTGETLEQRVDRMMADENLKVEVRTEEGWVDEA